MKIDKDELKKALATAVKFTERKSMMPVLGCVLVDGEAGKLYATDLEHSCAIPLKVSDVEKVVSDPDKNAREEFVAELSELKVAQLRNLAADYGIEIPAKGKGSVIVDAIVVGSTLVKASETGARLGLNANSLKRIIDSLDETGMIEFKEAPGKVSIGQHFHEIYTMPTDEFPIPFLTTEIVGTVTMKRSDLEKVLPAATIADVGFKLSGVYFDKKGDLAITTDGHRLHMASAKVLSEKSFQVSTQFFKKLPHGKEDEELVIEACGNENDVHYARVLSEAGEFTSRVMDTQFPDYTAVVPKKSTYSVKVTRKDVMVAIKQGLVMSDARSRAARLTFNGGIDVAVENPDSGKYDRAKVAMIGHVDPPLTIGLNLKYLVDAMPGKKDDDEFTVELTDSSHPVIFRKDTFTALVMPIRV